MMTAVGERSRPSPLPNTCAGLESLPLAQVGYIDWNLHVAAPAVPRGGVVDLTSPVVNTCPRDWGPWNIALGNCGLDTRWRYVVVFDFQEGIGYDRATAHGGPMRGTVEVVDPARRAPLCQRRIAFAIDEEPFIKKPDAERIVLKNSYQKRAYAAICAEVAALGAGALPTPRHWNCGLTETR